MAILHTQVSMPGDGTEDIFAGNIILTSSKDDLPPTVAELLAEITKLVTSKRKGTGKKDKEAPLAFKVRTKIPTYDKVTAPTVGGGWVDVSEGADLSDYPKPKKGGKVEKALQQKGLDDGDVLFVNGVGVGGISDMQLFHAQSAVDDPMPTTVLPWFTALEGRAMVQVYVVPDERPKPAEERPSAASVRNAFSIYPERGCQAFVYRMKCEAHLLALLLRRWPLRGSEKYILRKAGESISRKAFPHPTFVL